MLLRNRTFLIAMIILVPFALGILYVKFYSSSEQDKLSLGRVKRESLIQRVTIAGVVAAQRKTIIMAPYNGYVKKLYAKVGDKVKKGDPIVSVVQSLQAPDNVYPLRSPFDGVVVQVEKAEGEYVKEGDVKEFILRIDDIDKLFVMASAPEIDRVKVKSNQQAIVKASAILDRSYSGILRELSLAAREKGEWSRSQVVEFPIRIEITDQDEKLKPGMSVVVDIITDQKDNVLTLRHEYIRRENSDYFVLLKGGRKQSIKVGLRNEEAFEILDGLKEGDFIEQVDFTKLQVD